MSISAILEVAIGLAFLYLLLSLFVSWINEWIAQLLELRAKSLKRAIQNLLKDPPEYLKDPERYLQAHPEHKSFVEEFYGHALIKALSKEKDDKEAGGTKVAREPSYIPARTFALVALNVLFHKKDKDYANKTHNQLRALIETVPHPDTREALLTFWEAGAKTVEELRSEVETWFNDTMDQLSGWYKRRARELSFIVGLVLVVSLNIDTLVVADALWREPTLRTSVTKYVEEHLDDFAPPEEEQENINIPVDDIREALTSLEWPVGWTTYAPRTSEMIGRAEEAGQTVVLAVLIGWLAKLVGWSLTGLAVSQGAPFWFDLLNKLVNLRSSGPVPKEADKIEAPRPSQDAGCARGVGGDLENGPSLPSEERLTCAERRKRRFLELGRDVEAYKAQRSDERKGE